MNHTGWYDDQTRDKVYTKTLVEVVKMFHLEPVDDDFVAADVARETKNDITDLNAIQGRMKQYIHRCMMRLRRGNRVYVPVEVQQVGRKCYKASGIDWQAFILPENFDTLLGYYKTKKSAAADMKKNGIYAHGTIKPPMPRLERCEQEMNEYLAKYERAVAELPRITERYHHINQAFVYGESGLRLDMSCLDAAMVKEVEDVHTAHNRGEVIKRSKVESAREVLCYYGDYKDQFEAEVRELPSILDSIEEELNLLRIAQAYESPSYHKDN